MSGDNDDRAEKLAGRWGESGTEAGTNDDAETVESGGPATDAERVDAGQSSETTGTDAEQDGDDELTTREKQSQMLYLAPELYRELDLTFEELKLRYRRERDGKLQKNRDFYAGLLRLGLAQLGDVRERDLDDIDDDLDL